MLQLQAKTAGDPIISERLNAASMRIVTVARAYDRLAYAADYEKIELTAYLREVLKEIEAAVSPYDVVFEATAEIQFSADRAILLALIINELASNAAKYAYGGQGGGTIWVKVTATERSMLVSVRDEGVGLAADFDANKSKGLGTRLVVALAKQLDAELLRPPSATGTNFTLRYSTRRSRSPLSTAAAASP